MSEMIEQRGLFWWAELANLHPEITPNVAIAGFLTVTEEGSIRLRIDGNLSTASLPRLPLGRTEPLSEGPMIAGVLTESRSYVVLDSVSIFGMGPSELYSAGACLIGDLPLRHSIERLEFSRFEVDMKGLEEWLQLDSIEATMISNKDDKVDWALSYKQPSFHYDLGGYSVTLRTQMNAPYPFFTARVTEANFRQESWLALNAGSGLSSLAAQVRQFTRIEEFFAILLGSYFRLDWPYLVCGTSLEEKWFRMYYTRGSYPKYEPTLNNTLTWFSWLHESLGTLLCNWFANRDAYGPGYYLYLAGMRKPDLYVEHIFVNLVWALESLHRKKTPVPTSSKVSSQVERILSRFNLPEDSKDRKWLKGKLKFAGEPTLEQRIFESFIGLPLGLDKTALRSFSSLCAKRRNEISHTGGPSNQETYSNFHQELVLLSDALSFLYAAKLLHELGLPENRLNDGFRSSFLARARILPSWSHFGLIA